MQSYRCAGRWKGETACIIGNGTSLRGLDLSPLRRFRVATVNQSHLLVPDADLLMCSDRHWLKAKADWETYRGPLIIVTRPDEVVVSDPRMRSMKRGKIWETIRPFANPGLLVEGHTSVSTSMSFLTMEEVSTILLFGIDLAPGPDGKRRWDSDEPDTANAAARYEMIRSHLKMMSTHLKRRLVKVINVNENDTLPCFEWRKPKEFLSC